MLGPEKIQNRFGFHAGTELTIPKHEAIRHAFTALAEFLDKELGLCDGDTVEIVFEKLQEASMWANFGVAQLTPLAPKKPYVSTNRPTPSIMNAKGPRLPHSQ